MDVNIILIFFSFPITSEVQKSFFFWYIYGLFRFLLEKIASFPLFSIFCFFYLLTYRSSLYIPNVTFKKVSEMNCKYFHFLWVFCFILLFRSDFNLGEIMNLLVHDLCFLMTYLRSPFLIYFIKRVP